MEEKIKEILQKELLEVKYKTLNEELIEKHNLKDYPYLSLLLSVIYNKGYEQMLDNHYEILKRRESL